MLPAQDLAQLIDCLSFFHILRRSILGPLEQIVSKSKIRENKDTQIWSCNTGTAGFNVKQTEADNEQLKKKGRQKPPARYATRVA